MSTSFDQQVHDAIGEQLDRVTVPRPDPATLVLRARRRSAIRNASGLAACVAGVIGIVTVLTLGGGTKPVGREHVGGLPIATSGADGPVAVDGPTAVFHTKQNVWIDGVRYPAGNFAWDTGAHIGKLGVAYPDDQTGRPYLMLRNGEQVPLGPEEPAFGSDYAPWVAADASSPLVAWVERDDREIELVAFDTESMTEIARRHVTCEGKPDTWGYACVMPYVADSGVVFVHDQDFNTVAWQPADGTWQVLGKGLASQAHGRVLGLFAGSNEVDVSILGSGWWMLQVSGPHWEKKMRSGDIEPLLSFDVRPARHDCRLAVRHRRLGPLRHGVRRRQPGLGLHRDGEVHAGVGAVGPGDPAHRLGLLTSVRFGLTPGLACGGSSGRPT
jgi:hypothetical protein